MKKTPDRVAAGRATSKPMLAAARFSRNLALSVLLEVTGEVPISLA
jgi:hypothetical protein